MLKFKCPLLAVSDMERSIQFYEEVIGDRVAMDFGANVQFEGGFALQEMKSWKSMIHTETVRRKNNAVELYFEEDDFDGFVKYLKEFPEIQYVHRVEEMPWGQRIIRFYDPDFHIIEVGEAMDAVIKKMLKSGMTVEQVSEKSQYPIEYIQRLVK
jgi:catechol 2,3-dioxygenase-like lactoylglutathione lyase family enzyme